MNEPTHQHLGEWEKDMQSYTQLLSGSYISLGEHENQQLAQEPPQEHGVVTTKICHSARWSLSHL